MRLTELDPKWLLIDGRRAGLVFRCPHCQNCYLSCFFVPMPHICGDDLDCQYALFAQVIPEDQLLDTVPCKRDFAWTSSPAAEEATFENISITPSLDASASGHWHGHVTNGSIA